MALIRHALAPGTGDPAAFTLEDCNTQRNLSDRGRGQAARIGDRFRERGIETVRVFSSQWCRCLETAELLGLGPVEELPILNSFYERRENEERQTRGLEGWLAEQDLDRPVVLVTHQVNITALTGVFPTSGEMVVIRRSQDGGLVVVGTIETD
ncbi:MAG: histidine phosphatase family protein [Kiloniellales bacterium]|nr:histidine phosphatase family protein [Kiloniellales bacterium]